MRVALPCVAPHGTASIVNELLPDSKSTFSKKLADVAVFKSFRRHPAVVDNEVAIQYVMPARSAHSLDCRGGVACVCRILRYWAWSRVFRVVRRSIQRWKQRDARLLIPWPTWMLTRWTAAERRFSGVFLRVPGVVVVAGTWLRWSGATRRRRRRRRTASSTSSSTSRRTGGRMSQCAVQQTADRQDDAADRRQLHLHYIRIATILYFQYTYRTGSGTLCCDTAPHGAVRSAVPPFAARRQRTGCEHSQLNKA